MPEAKYVIGIDLGTTNTVVSYAPIQPDAPVRLLPIPQMVAEGEIGALETLPSVAFVDGGQGVGSASQLECSENGLLVGKLAKTWSSTRSESCILSAKSWLSYSGVNRNAPILPWGASDEGRKYSPVEVSAEYLIHVRSAWDAAFPNNQMCNQEVVLTVPASFDDTARRLTVEAARRAGITGALFLIEEPQSAFYDQMSENGASIQNGGLVLVVDVGGGTTDLTLIECRSDAELADNRFERVAVGAHLLLGGDNMDLLLAYEAERRILGRNGSLNSRMMSHLVSSCRSVKEKSFSSVATDTVTVSLPSRGSRLVQGTRSCTFECGEIVKLLTTAFMPWVPASARVERGSGLALSALGLPYEQEPLLTKHIASFLSRHEQLGFPSHVLFNGGVFRGKSLRTALFDVLARWAQNGGHEIMELPEGNLDTSVARGASVYGLSRHDFGGRIGGGVSANYFVTIERRNKKGRRKGKAGLCVLPKGSANTTRLHVDSQVFNLVAGRPIKMSILCGGSDPAVLGSTKGDSWDDYLSLPAVQTVVHAHEEAQHVPVTLSACMSELGLLELCAHAVDRADVYQFEFKASQDQLHQAPSYDSILSDTQGDMQSVESHLLSVFGKADPNADPKEIRRLFHALESFIGAPRSQWNLSTLRRVFDLLIKCAKRRRRSERHEMSFLFLSGFCLRPGLGDSFDEWRVGEMWRIFHEGVHFHQRLENWDAWWIAWRRIAGGLSQSTQQSLYEQINPWLDRVLSGTTTKKDKLRQPNEALRLLAGLERVSIKDKIKWGHRFADMLESGDELGLAGWCLGRIGAREMVYGGAEAAVGPLVAQSWLSRLLNLDWSSGSMVQQCVVSLSRCTGDRERDLDPEFRKLIIDRLIEERAPEDLISSVQKPTLLRVEETNRLLGDTLPDGLRLIV